ncbi:MAG: FxSxx-COOH cyclophane-containing RiPP peptide [Pseudonocardiaceae bacterium]
MTDPWLDHEADLVDLTDLPLSEVLIMGESVLAQSLSRLAQETDRQEDVVAGFSNYLM